MNPNDEEKMEPIDTGTFEKSSAGFFSRYPEAPYCLPFFAFILLTGLAPYIGLTWGYPIKTLVVAGILAICWKNYEPMKVSHWPLAILLGLLVLVIWVIPEGTYPLLTTPEGFDPFASIPGKFVFAWIAFRVIGASVLVPIIEEVFWRNFLLRWLINPDLKKSLWEHSPGLLLLSAPYFLDLNTTAGWSGSSQALFIVLLYIVLKAFLLVFWPTL